MIFAGNSKWMLKCQKAKAKLVEYHVAPENYPKFKLNSNELSYPTTYILSRYSECIIDNNNEEINELEPLLTATAQYYDAAVNSKDRREYDFDFLLSGAAAYFLSNDFGSAKVLVKKAGDFVEADNHNPQQLLLKILGYFLCSKSFKYIKLVDTYAKVNNIILDFFYKGEQGPSFMEILKQYQREVYSKAVPDDIFYVDILLAIVLKAKENSSWNLLPKYSKLSIDVWKPYLEKQHSIKMLWPAQKLIGEKGIMSGKNAIVQLPTGVGKTKSIELIIRATFLSNRANAVIIVAPLRALCNEIASDMIHAFGKEATVNQFSDVLQNDVNNLLNDRMDKTIVVCTPEKLSYVVHHQPDFLHNINLFIFDEGHMFDDGKRGATYELLVTHIKKILNESQQFILLSAVLPNSEQIKEWLFQDNGVLAADKRIVSTPKSVGFSSSSKDIYFYSDNPEESDYYIPRILQPQLLAKRPRERKDRYFPNLSESVDVAIYNAIKLCSNGGAAIYMAQQRSIKTIFEKLWDLHDRGYDLSSIKSQINECELEKLCDFISEYYGDEFIFYRVGKLGVLPHSANIPNGIKLAIEYALKHEYVRLVVCTSTLAQGVNIPIKYLFITSLHNSRAIMKVRNFQNLIGRTARSGIYTEGSVIITDTKIYDQRKSRQNGGKHKWENCIELFDPNSAEPCSSSILMLVKDIVIDNDSRVHGKELIHRIIEHFENESIFEHVSDEEQKAYIEKHPDKKYNNIMEEIMLRKSIFDAIENYLCLALTNDAEQDKYLISKDICQNTLAYALAEEDEKQLLEQIFYVITKKIEIYNPEQLRNFSKSMSGIDLSSIIEKWLSEKEITTRVFTDEELQQLVLDFFKETHNIKKCAEHFDVISRSWIGGKTPIEIHEATGCDIFEIDEVCNKNISYELNFFIGNICDMIHVDEDDESQVNTSPSLSLLQKKVKYGVPSKTAVSICEKVFNDRIISIKMAEKIGKDNIDDGNIIFVLKQQEANFFDFLNGYPEYFSDRLKFVLQ